MKYAVFTCFLFLAGTLSAADIFRADDLDPYLQSGFTREDAVNQMLDKASHTAFAEKFAEQFSNDFDADIQYEALKMANVDTWEMELFEKRRKQFQFLKDYPEMDQLSPEFIELIKTNINYNYWHLLLAYSINRSNENTGIKVVNSLPAIMTEPLESAKINKPGLLISRSFREFLPYYITYFNSKENKFKKYTAGVQSITDKAEFASRRFEGTLLDYSLTRILAQYYALANPDVFRFWTSQIYDEQLQAYLNDNYYDKVVDLSKNKVAAKAEKAKSKNEVNLLDLQDKTFSLDKFKGKVVYVDFWASWCGPCRAEFPYSKKMHEGLSDNQKKDIVFLYISIDQNLEKWKEAVEKLGLKEYGENGHSFEIAMKYQIRSIPRYMIIDKTGKIVNQDAPRPSNPETLNMLLELL